MQKRVRILLKRTKVKLSLKSKNKRGNAMQKRKNQSKNVNCKGKGKRSKQTRKRKNQNLKRKKHNVKRMKQAWNATAETQGSRGQRRETCFLKKNAVNGIGVECFLQESDQSRCFHATSLSLSHTRWSDFLHTSAFVPFLHNNIRNFFFPLCVGWNSNFEINY